MAVPKEKAEKITMLWKEYGESLRAHRTRDIWRAVTEKLSLHTALFGMSSDEVHRMVANAIMTRAHVRQQEILTEIQQHGGEVEAEQATLEQRVSVFREASWDQFWGRDEVRVVA